MNITFDSHDTHEKKKQKKNMWLMMSSNIKTKALVWKHTYTIYKNEIDKWQKLLKIKTFRFFFFFLHLGIRS